MKLDIEIENLKQERKQIQEQIKALNSSQPIGVFMMTQSEGEHF
jgi:hypothetical protein